MAQCSKERNKQCLNDQIFQMQSLNALATRQIKMFESVNCTCDVECWIAGRCTMFELSIVNAMYNVWMFELRGDAQCLNCMLSVISCATLREGSSPPCPMPMPPLYHSYSGAQAMFTWWEWCFRWKLWSSWCQNWGTYRSKNCGNIRVNVVGISMPKFVPKLEGISVPK